MRQDREPLPRHARGGGPRGGAHEPRPRGTERDAGSVRAFDPADQVIVAGFFDADIRESYEMLYQYDSEYLFDSTRFSTAFHFIPTSYEDGIRRCATP